MPGGTDFGTDVLIRRVITHLTLSSLIHRSCPSPLSFSRLTQIPTTLPCWSWDLDPWWQHFSSLLHSVFLPLPLLTLVLINPLTDRWLLLFCITLKSLLWFSSHPSLTLSTGLLWTQVPKHGVVGLQLPWIKCHLLNKRVDFKYQFIKLQGIN